MCDRATGSPLKPLIKVPVDLDAWQAWCKEKNLPPLAHHLRGYATEVFSLRVQQLALAARERTPHTIIPNRYILAITECIGQDEANDISHLAVIHEQPHGEPWVREIVRDIRMFHMHALALAAAYALVEGIDAVLYQKDLRYAWH
ncbi:MAG: hypothetical protein GIKADHBN_01566 [Phycisphaerales bacterium]|nr:hypothetical protein [Phycisphaerales bacterium]